MAVAGDEAVHLSFAQPMDPACPVEAALQLVPAHAASLSWNAARTKLSIAPERRWRNDEAYLVVVGASATTADGAALATPRQFAFSTQTAPVVSDFAVQLAGVDLQEAAPAKAAVAALRLEQNLSEDRTLTPDETARDVSAVSPIRISFTSPMSRSDVEERFTISPAVAGDLSWSGRDLIFTPTERLQPGGRYTISLAGAHDRTGNSSVARRTSASSFGRPPRSFTPRRRWAHRTWSRRRSRCGSASR